MIDQDSAWHDTLEIVKVSVSPAIFSTWFSQTHISKVDDVGERTIIEIGCPTSYAKNTIESRYFGLLQDSLTKVFGKPCDISFVIQENPNKNRGSSKGLDEPLFQDVRGGEDLTEVFRKARIR